MNKKLLIIVVVLSFIFANSANAAVLSGSDTIAPDSPFYFLQTWKESIQTFFTFGAENKAKQYLHLAEVRLNEYQKMVEKGKTEIAEKTLNKYEDQLSRALAKVQELKNQGKNIDDLSQKIKETTSKNLEVLQENLQKVPEAAKKGIENAIENSQKSLENVLGEEGKSQMANPASVNCEKQGGTLEIRKDVQGNETGFCIFSNGSECEEWALWKGECKKTEKTNTSNWKTYRNEKYGFEVKYPADFNQDLENTGYLRFISAIRGGAFSIDILDKKFDSNNITYKGSDSEGGIKTYKVENALKVKIGDRYAYQYSEGISDAGCGPEIAFQTSLGDKTLHIAFSNCENDALENNDILLILSTFKFIK